LPETKKAVRAATIVRAACKLFACQGYHATSTREIAQLAGVSENTIFRHFSSKEGLFWATLQFHFAGLELPKELLDELAQRQAPEVVLSKILELLSNTADFNPDLLRLIAVAFLELQGKMDGFCHRHLSPLLNFINNYFEMSIESGKIRDLDATMLTSALVMTTLTHPRICNMIDSDKPSYSSRLKMRRAYTSFWLEVLAPAVLTDSHAVTIREVKDAGNHNQ
jgi:AcrR family transcriptional regulator